MKYAVIASNSGMKRYFSINISPKGMRDIDKVNIKKYEEISLIIDNTIH